MRRFSYVKEIPYENLSSHQFVLLTNGPGVRTVCPLSHVVKASDHFLQLSANDQQLAGGGE
jgi:hypothetical protein